MKTVIRGALALTLLATTAGSALAQDQGGRGRWRDGGDGEPMPGARPEGRQQPNFQPPPQAAPSTRPDPMPEARSEPRPQTRIESPQPRGPEVQSPTPTMGGWQRDANGHNWRGEPQARPEGGHPQGGVFQDRDPRGNPPPIVVAPPGYDGRRPEDHHDRHEGNHRHDDDHRDDRHRQDWDNHRGDDHAWNDNRDWQWRGNDDRRDRFEDRHQTWRYHSPQRYRGWDYRPPFGFYTHSWAFGEFLPHDWWSQDYTIDDWWRYGLPQPPRGYQWVRVGADALMIDRYDGRVVRVVYDVFW